MKKLFSLFISCALGANALAQTPCVDGFADGYPCEKIDLQSMMPLSALGSPSGLNDIWGWLDPLDNKEYALVGTRNGTVFVDITNPISPVYLGNLPTYVGEENTWRDIKVYQNHAFIASEQNGHGIQVFDLTHLRDVPSPPMTFTEDAHFDGVSNCHNLAMNEDSGYLYAIGTNQAGGGPVFINVQDPINPTNEGNYSDYGYSHDAQIVMYNGPDTDYQGDEIYIGFHGNNADGLTIVNVTDKSDPEGILAIGYDCQDYTHQGWITPDHRYCFISDELDELTFGFNTRTRIFDIQDLDAPVLIGNYISDNSATDHNLYATDQYTYMSNYSSGLRVIDHSLLDNDIMEEVAYFDVHPNDNNAGFSGTWSNYPFFPSGNIPVTSRELGLFVVKLQDMTGVVPTQAINLEICPAELSVAEFGLTQFSIFPNPATDLISVEMKSETIESIIITDLMGKQVLILTGSMRAAQLLDLSELSKGMYMVTINNDFSSSQRLSVK
jgi:choice-of-anchor B domain-containing protein